LKDGAVAGLTIQSLKETILEEEKTNKMTSALLMEIFGPNLFDHTKNRHTFSEMLC
jgi:hypothetical protein